MNRVADGLADNSPEAQIDESHFFSHSPPLGTRERMRTVSEAPNIAKHMYEAHRSDRIRPMLTLT